MNTKEAKEAATKNILEAQRQKREAQEKEQQKRKEAEEGKK